LLTNCHLMNWQKRSRRKWFSLWKVFEKEGIAGTAVTALPFHFNQGLWVIFRQYSQNLVRSSGNCCIGAWMMAL
jgi:hypothetical protein